MKNWWEDLKKIGAGITIVLLALMMTLMFSGQSTDEIAGVLVGRGGAGGFDGQTIPLATYGEVDARCRDRIRQIMGGGQAPDYFVRNCVNGSLKELYVLPKIAGAVGLDVPASEIQRQVAEQAQAQFAAQGAQVHPDDRLSVKEIYNRLIQQSSIDMQRRGAVADRVRRTLGGSFPLPDSLSFSEDMSRDISIRLRLVRYTAEELLENTDTKIEVSEEEIRLAFEKEQAGVSDEKRKNFETEKKFVKNRLIQERKQVELSKVKESLGKLTKDVGLEDVAGLTGAKIRTPGRVSLSELQRVDVRDGGGPLNLAIPGFMLDLGKKGDVILSGPHQIGSSTVYVEVSDFRVPEKYARSEVESAKEKLERAADRSAARDTGADQASQLNAALFQYLVDQTAERGRFEVYVPGQSQGQPGSP